MIILTPEQRHKAKEISDKAAWKHYPYRKLAHDSIYNPEVYALATMSDELRAKHEYHVAMLEPYPYTRKVNLDNIIIDDLYNIAQLSRIWNDSKSSNSNNKSSSMYDWHI